MYRWLQRLFSSPQAPTVPSADSPAPAPAAAATAIPAPASSTPLPAQPVPFEQAEQVNAAWHTWLFERDPDRDGLETSAAETAVLAGLAATLAVPGSGAALVRRLPGLVPKLLQSLRSDSFSGAVLARTISSDPVLVAAIVRLANTAYEGSGATVASVEQAVILIGQEGLRQLITSVAFHPIIDVQAGWYTRRLAPRLWEHSERCATAARRLAAEMKVEPFDAFLAGLLQNVGLVVALRAMDRESANAPGMGSAIYLAQLARDTRRLGASIAQEWHFPQAVVTALLEQGGMRKDAPVSPLGRLLRLTDHLGKLRLLAEDGRLELDPNLAPGAAPLAQLPALAASCYAALAPYTAPAASVTPAA